MAEETTKFPGKAEENKSSRPAEWRPLESLRRELDRLCNEFGVGSWRSPLICRATIWMRRTSGDQGVKRRPVAAL